MKLTYALIGLVLPFVLFAKETRKKEKPVPSWTAREEKYVKAITTKLEALPGEDPRKLLIRYFEFLHEPTEGKGKDFADEALSLREKSGQPLAGVGFFSLDKSLCAATKDCSNFSIGSLSDKHLGPLLRAGNPGAIRVAIVRHLVSVPSHAELMSYHADFKVPRVVKAHFTEVLTVLHDLREALAKYNPGKNCYHFKFFDETLTPEKVRKGLPAKEAEELIAACAPAAQATPAPAAK